METLKLMIEDLFISNGYIYTKGDIEAAAEYIELANSNRGEDEEVYTPKRWLADTKCNNPDYLITKKELMYRSVNYLVHQKEMCLDQTGCQPCMYDFEQGIDCEDFINEVGIHGEDVNISDIFNFLLDCYVAEGFGN